MLLVFITSTNGKNNLRGDKMKTVFIGLLTIVSLSAFASKAEYCKTVKAANLNEIYRHIILAAKQTEVLEIDKIMEEMAKVEEIQKSVNVYCDQI